MKMSTVIPLLLAAFGIYWWLTIELFDPEEVVRESTVSDTQISYKGVDYEVEWSRESITFEGDVRGVWEAYNKFAPFNTHQVLITNGDFSDPSKVEIDGVDIKATLEEDLEGDITGIHLVPNGLSGLDSLRGIEIGQRVRIIGKEEADGLVRASDGGYIRFGTNGKGRPLVLVESIRVF